MDLKEETGGVKVLENLKKYLFDIQDSVSSPNKPLSSREVCASLTDLVASVSTAAQRPSSTQLVSNTVELLVHSCSSQDRDIRFAAAENLRKLIKALMNTHLSRLQQDLFHELKKNGSSRSLSAALDCFASLFPQTRPSRCNSYAQGLLPVLVRVTGREEEALHESLQEALSKILPTMTPFLSTSNLQFLMTGLVQRLPKASPSYRRMAASALRSLTTYSRQPPAIAEWLISKLLDMGCGCGASSELVQGVLLTLQQLFSNMAGIQLPLDMLKQVYAFTVSCLLYRDANTSISSLEALHQLLVSTTAELAVWLTTPLPAAQITTNFWADGGASDTASDTYSLGEGLETPCDQYFESEDLTLSFAGSKTKTRVVARSTSPDADLPSPAHTPAIAGAACQATPAGPADPLGNISHYILNSVLSNTRVSAQSLGIACITAAVDICPPILQLLEPLEVFAVADDPNLRCRFSKLLAVIIYSQLRANYMNYSCCPAIVPDAVEKLCTMLEDNTPVVLKATCESLQLCLPALTKSSRPDIAVTILHKLLPLCDSSYWLTKVELLQTLACLEFTSLAMTDNHLPRSVLEGVVFALLADSDHRVRMAACETLVSLAPCLQLTSQPLLACAQWEASRLFSDLHSTTIQLSLAGIADSTAKIRPLSPMGLEHLLWFLLGNISSSVDPNLQRGCLEALHCLSLHYPPPSLPHLWGCVESTSTLLTILQELLSCSRLAWGIQAHCKLLELTGSVFLGCALANMQHSAESGQSWCALSEPSLVSHANSLLSHIVKVLCIFAHIIEHREPETKESKRLSLPTVPRRASMGDTTSPSKPKPQLLESLQRPPLVPKDGIGQFAHMPHFLKIMDSCKAAYTNYQVSLAPVGEDKFSKMLLICHNTLAALLEVALADDVGKSVEELLGYLGITVKVDPSGSLLCVQQLLNALFGMNTAAQHTHLYSPYISSLPYDISSPASLGMPLSSLYDVTVTQPLRLMTSWLQSPPPSTLLTPAEEQTDIKKSKFGLFRRALVVKPVNPVSSIKDYIGYFEPLVVLALRQFSYTSSLLLQQRVLFLLVQLLHLKVRYELLDCNHSFLESVLKLVGLMESESVRGGENLVPHLFQFLVLLANDQSKLITVPQVMQKCDGVMASGHNVDTFAIPALQPLVLNLFVRPSRETEDLEIQREVLLNMLLRLVKHSRVMVLLTYVLDCYRRISHKWNEVSNQIYAALLPQIGKLNVLLDSNEALVAIYQLFTAMDPGTISVQALFTSVLKQHFLTSLSRLFRWLRVVCTVLELMITIFPEITLFKDMGPQVFQVPQLECALASVDGESIPGDREKPSQLAAFLLGALHLAASTLNQLHVKRSPEDYHLLPTLTINMMLLLQSLVEGSKETLPHFLSPFAKVIVSPSELVLSSKANLLPCLVSSGSYQSLKSSLSSLPHPTLNKIFQELSSSYPLLTLQYVTLMLRVHATESLQWVLQLLSQPSSNSLLHHCALLLVCEQCDPKEAGRAVALCPAIMQHCRNSSVKSFLTAACTDSAVQQSLLEMLKGVDLGDPVQCMQAVRLCACVPSCGTLHYLCSHLITHPLPTVADTATRTAVQLIPMLGSELTSEVAAKLVEELRPHKERCSGDLFSTLCEMSGQHIPSPTLTEEDTILNVQQVTQSWFLGKVSEFCSSPHVVGEVCAQVLGTLTEADLREVVGGDSFPMSLLECCIVHGVKLSLNRRTQRIFDQMELSATESQPPQLHPLLQVCANCLLVAVKTNSHDLTLIRPLVCLLSSRHQLPSPVLLENDVAVSIATLGLHSLAHSQSDHLSLRLALDCCSLALQTPEICSSVTDKWVCQAILQLYEIMRAAYPAVKLNANSSDEKQLQEDVPLERAKGQLRSVLDVLLHPASYPTSYMHHTSLEVLAFTLSRHPLVHPAVMMPPALLGEGSISEKLLDQAVMESDILHQFMQRCNAIGWLNRHQFEERWMQLLGVVNQPPPPEGTPQEEGHAHMINVCAGVQAVTSLLLNANLRPSPGDPISSIPLHTHRNSDVLFLGSRPGRKLARLRCLLELQLLLQCGHRPNLYSCYQNPLLHHVSSPHYPPLYTRNVERLMGDTSTGSGQMSLNSLWPIMLMSATSGGRPVSDDVDIRSCILTLIDLYNHWLSQPIHTLLLQHMVHSIIMLSDLFALSGQFCWMLATLLDLYNHHPSEDTTTTALLVLGVLKATAVLKVDTTDAEKIAKIVEKSLSSSSTVPVQNGCLRGLLYVVEDPNSTMMHLIGPALAKFIPTHLLTFPRFTESHTKLVWSVAVSITILHSHHLKDLNFTSHLLDCVVPLLFHPHTSTSLFHSITLGLELMVVNFALTAEERTSLARTAASRFSKCDQSKSLALLALLITCMYTGEEADVVSGLTDMDDSSMETALQAREHISNLMERLRHGPLIDVSILVDLLPQLVVDFLPSMEVLQTVVTEFVSPHQTRPHLAACVMAETFCMLLKHGQEAVVTEWVMLSLESFVQQEPERKAVWSIACLLTAASTSDTLRSMFLLIAHWHDLPEHQAISMLCIASQWFYTQQCIQHHQELFLDKFKHSKYMSLKQVAKYCLHH